MNPRRKKILFVCGAFNQTTQMHQVAQQLSEFDCVFTPYYTTGFYRFLRGTGVLRFTSIMGPYQTRLTRDYLAEHRLPVDYRGESGDYDMAVLCTDLLVAGNIRRIPIVLVQEGITDKETFLFKVVKAGRPVVPRWIDKTSTTGLSDAYDRFCVASDGYRDLFVKKGVRPEKIVVTGIPNFDNAARYLTNDIPHKDYVLVCTSDIRENFGFDNRAGFLRKAGQIAAGRRIIVKLHPNERYEKRRREVEKTLPDAIVLREENPHHLIANCHTLIVQWSTLAFTGLALGKQVHSYFDVEELKRLQPIQNGGTSSVAIANVCREVIERRPRGARPS